LHFAVKLIDDDFVNVSFSRKSLNRFNLNRFSCHHGC